MAIAKTYLARLKKRVVMKDVCLARSYTLYCALELVPGRRHSKRRPGFQIELGNETNRTCGLLAGY